MSKHKRNKLRSELYAEQKVDAKGEKLPEQIGTGLTDEYLATLDNEVKSEVYQIRLTPFEKAKLLNDPRKISKIFKPVIDKICKKK